MSLDFSYAKVKDWKVVSTSPFDKNEWHPVGNALVWASIPCGYNSITETNVDEVWHRIHVYQAITGALLANSEGPIFLTKDDVVRYIGLHTNASPKTPLEFWKTVRAWIDAYGKREDSAYARIEMAAKKAKARKSKAAA